ncbi:adenylate kinase 7-like isoform X2 [Betta splendens]|uniref:Adenylate kinase 7-like isoform X2 n=1 Tax=Betta splendens TaxID=158456 RepID=A0A6P7LPW4_BETSP|nr:adenylate kinase 7-like isoform X2 [Betta splendens]
MGDQQTHPKRVFISDVDGFSSRSIAEFLSACAPAESPEAEQAPASPFQVVATASPSSADERRSFLLEQHTSPTRDELLQRLLECDVVVYNIAESATQQQLEEATWAITALHAEVEKFKSRKMFILVSTVMSRAVATLQNPVRLEEEDGVLVTEEQFRRRRPHPSFKLHDQLEKLVLKLGRSKKPKLTCYVVACGLQYGRGENLFHYFFKVSWLMQCPDVPIFGLGRNYIPTIHVYDLAGVIQNIIELRPASKYILAVDDSKNTLGDIVQAISDKLGPGTTVTIPEEEAIAMSAFQPHELEYLRINLRLDAFVIKDSFNLHWTCEAGMVENMEKLVEEYKVTRQLLPVRICLVGPPAAGKSTVAKKLCSHYQIHHVTITQLIEETVTRLRATASGGDPAAAAAAQTRLENMTKSLELNAGRLADHLVFDILQERLNSKPCRNHGFVLEGYPKTYEQAKLIFLDEETEDQDSKVKTPEYNKNITPEHVIVLEASDDFLTKRVQGLPESVAEEMRFTQAEFGARLTRYRRRAAAEETLLDFFDELEIHPEHVEVTTGDPEYADVMKEITAMVGMPRNYGRSPQEQEAEDRKSEEERKQKVAAAAAERRRGNEAALAEMAAQYEEWANLSEVKTQERALQEARALPLRNYLMKYVMPSLTEAMLECSQVRPEDPVEFLAEYLLRKQD